MHLFSQVLDPSDTSAADLAYRILRPRVLPLDQIHSNDLPRDRLDLAGEAGSQDMLALKRSIEQRGQRTPITICRDAQDRYQLVSGWRRMTALQQLAEDRGDDAPVITARLTGKGEARIDLYKDMVECNLLHRDLSFAELAQLALTAAADPALQDMGVGEVVTALFGSVHKMKRSYIRSFVTMLQILGSSLKFPKNISRNQGVAVSRRLKAAPETAAHLRQNLQECPDEVLQSAVLAQYLSSFRRKLPQPPVAERRLQLGKTHVTGRRGECVIKAEFDFASVETAILSRAVRAFEQILQKG